MAVDFRHVVGAAAALAGGLTVAVVAQSTPSHAFRSAVPAADLSRIPTASLTLSSPSTPGAASGHPSSWSGPLLLAVILLVVVVLAGLAARRGRSPQHDGRRTGRTLLMPGQPAAGSDEQVMSALDESCAVLARGPVREAVVACWILMEDAAVRAGMALEPAETAADFAARVRRTRDVAELPLHRLAELYREARFSDHPMGERARGEARTCVEAIRAQLSSADVGD